MAQYIETPDGLVEFPDDMSLDEIKAVLDAQYGLPEVVPPESPAVETPVPSPEEQLPSKTPLSSIPTAKVEPTFLEKAQASAVEMLPEFGATGLGIAGTAVGGPLLGIPMAGLGGAFGEVLQNLIQGDETKPMELLQEGLLQAAFEGGGTLVAKIGGQIVRITPQILRDLSITTSDAASALQQVAKKRPDLIKPGTEESIKMTQEILRGGRIDPITGKVIEGTLTKAQTGKESILSRIAEQFGRIGMSGAPQFETLQAKNDQIILGAFDDLVRGLAGRVRDPSEIGETFTQTVNAGRSALTKQYGEGLTNIQQQFAGKFIDTLNLKSAVDKRIADGTIDFDSIDPAIRTVYEEISLLPRRMNADRALEFLKKHNNTLSNLLDPRGQGYNSAASAQMTEFLDDVLKPSIKAGLAKADPQAYVEYQKLNKFYKDGKDSLTPKLLEAVARQGTAGNFTAVGSTLFGSTKADVVDAAFNALTKAKKINPDLNIREATEALRQGYLTQFFGSEGRSIDQLRTAAKGIESNTNKGQMFDKVLGVSAPGFKKLLNAAVDSAQGPGEGVLSLSMRGREIGAFETLAGAGFLGAGFMDSAIGMAGAAVLLMSPAVLAKISTNPKAVERLINIDKASKSMKPAVLSSAMIRFGNEFGIPIEEEGKRLLEQMVAPTIEEQAMIGQLPQ